MNRRVFLYAAAAGTSVAIPLAASTKLSLPFRPIRSSVYTPRELFSGYDPRDSGSFPRSTDFSIYRYYVSNGATVSPGRLTSMMEGLHDSSITAAMRALLRGRNCIVAMGSHEMPRTDPGYRQLAEISRALTRDGYLMASGGGPGAMEATHVGAACAYAEDSTLDSVCSALSAVPQLPANLSDIVSPQGKPNGAVVTETSVWFEAAWRALSLIPNPAPSLALPTWRYGHEPTTPFASHIAKYFQNSVREDAITSIGTHGAIFTEGGAGTIEELFESAANDYFCVFNNSVPTVLLGKSYWTTTYPVLRIVSEEFERERLARHVLVTDDAMEAVRYLRSFRGPAAASTGGACIGDAGFAPRSSRA